MARTIRSSKLGAKQARLELKKLPGDKPHWEDIHRGLSIGYRPGSRAWIVRVFTGGISYRHKKLGMADDIADANDETVLSFAQAQRKAHVVYEELRAEGKKEEAHTIAWALDRYEADLKTRGRDAGNVARVRVHVGDGLAKKLVDKIEADELRVWRDGLVGNLRAGTINRTANGLMAALNLVADLDKRAADNRQAWRTGLKSIENADRSRNVILPEPVIRTIVEKSAAQGEEFQLLVDVLATTGARYDQVARLEIKDLQDRRPEPRVMMPVSRKGRGQKKITHRPVAVTVALAAKLRKAAGGREPEASLLTKRSGDRWRKSDHSRLFRRTVTAEGLDPSVTIYALRHSSIVRQLLAGVPGRVVAVHHDTSLAMIERAYSGHIDDHADSLTRGALLDLSKPQTPLRAAS